MPHVDTWAEWAVWPLRHLFSRKARTQEFRGLVDCCQYGFESEPQTTRKEAVREARALLRRDRAFDRRDELPPLAACSVFTFMTQGNLEALQRREAQGGKEPTPIQVYERGSLRELVIPAERQSQTPERAYDILSRHLEMTRKQDVQSSAPSLRITR